MPTSQYVACCRHHTNPVGTEWRWQMDDPETVIAGAIDNHVNMIKQFKGLLCNGTCCVYIKCDYSLGICLY